MTTTEHGFYRCSRCNTKVEAPDDTGERVCADCAPIARSEAEAALVTAQRTLGIEPEPEENDPGEPVPVGPGENHEL